MSCRHELSLKDERIFEVEARVCGQWQCWDEMKWTWDQIQERLPFLLEANPGLKFRIKFKVFADVG